LVEPARLLSVADVTRKLVTRHLTVGRGEVLSEVTGENLVSRLTLASST